MNKVNFFEPYLKRKYNKLMLYVIESIVAILLIISLVNAWCISTMEKEVVSVSHRMSSLQKNMNVQENHRKLKQVNGILRNLKNTEALIREKDIINDCLIYAICNCVPKNLCFQSINIVPGKVKIQGIAKDTLSIAQFKYTLEENVYFQDIFIPYICESQEGYTFTVMFDIKDVQKDATK
ncbi:PilN domain-containing protein [Marinisporobacter balticus]|uniref:Fimbrial assembly protein PilN n=1 Tax=Marinisporobacter balticus TaxID=2018667 RepID=A0A4R2KYL9_9FIRM|nr:PilN domain-containing protein [Marinisporobacter balticus]TCO79174.1 fimbrial assembly protein PilN [Marinisporobacter balticus]